jgi:2-isopropylmalate synthase
LVRALLDSQAQVVTLVAKSHTGHVERALRTTLEENLEMIRDTVSFLRGEGRRVFLDAEHFFDGYATDRAYALEAVRAAAESGAEVIALCDTNGGMLPDQVATSCATSSSAPARGSASTATTTPAAPSPTRWPRSTRAPRTCRARSTGTASAPATPTCSPSSPTCSSRRALELLEPHRLQESTRIAHAIAEVTNVPAYSRQPYVGSSAFAHKAGLHASAIKVDPDLYQHMDPKHVGNDMRMLVSDMAGRASIELKSRELGFDLDPSDEVDAATLARVLREPSRTRSCAATPSTRPTRASSCCCAVRSTAPCRTSSTSSPGASSPTHAARRRALRGDGEAERGGERVVQTGEGNGPVNALDHALRRPWPLPTRRSATSSSSTTRCASSMPRTARMP